MFSGTNISSIDLTSFKTATVKKMNGMFENSSFTTLNLSSFDTSEVTDFSGMFKNCSKLTSVDISNFSVESNPNREGMFEGCTALKSIKVGEKWAFDGSENLPTPSSGYWYGSDGTAYSSFADIPKYKADTYTSTKS